MRTLGIETSCDETAFAVITDTGDVCAHTLESSAHVHDRYGGVIPEIASRMHVEVMMPLIDEVLTQAGCGLDEIDLIAVTRGPGLPGSLLSGISIGKALSFALDKPLIGVNHIQAHLWAGVTGKDSFPFLGFVVSGGHTSLVWVESPEKLTCLGQTTDDAVGEAFDKVAKILDLGYPGGPHIDRLAQSGNRTFTRFPRSKTARVFDFSFSGIKTAVLYYVRQAEQQGVIPEDETLHRQWLGDVCASFQEACMDMLLDRLALAVEETTAQRIIIGGGVSANSRLRQAVTERPALEACDIIFPDKNLCTDNAVMVARLGQALFKRGYSSTLSMTTEPDMALGKL